MITPKHAAYIMWYRIGGVRPTFFVDCMHHVEKCRWSTHACVINSNCRNKWNKFGTVGWFNLLLQFQLICLLNSASNLEDHKRNGPGSSWTNRIFYNKWNDDCCTDYLSLKECSDYIIYYVERVVCSVRVTVFCLWWRALSETLFMILIYIQ